MPTMRTTTFIGAILLGTATGGAAQGLPPPTPGLVPDYQQLLAEYESAQAAAHRPGDESLGCDALKSELEAFVSDPDLKAYIETSGATARQDFALMQGAQAAMMAGVPAANITASPAAAMDRVQDRAKQMEMLTALMPKMLRAQRVTELATLQACDWLADGGMPMPDVVEPAPPNDD